MPMRIGSLQFAFLTLMCGRTVVSLAPDDMVRSCTFRGRKGKRKRPVWKDAPGGQQYRTSYNMAPGSFSPVLVASERFDESETSREESERVMTPMKWGLVPSWFQGDPFKVPYETNNCRVEGMLDKKTFKVPLHRGYRCVILVDGFYEWKTTKSGKQPYFFYFPGVENSSQLGTESKTKEQSDPVSWQINVAHVKTEDSNICWKGEKLSVKAEMVDDDDELLLNAVELPRCDAPAVNRNECTSDSSFCPSSKVKDSLDLNTKYGNSEKEQKVTITKSLSLWDEVFKEDTNPKSQIKTRNGDPLSTHEDFNNGDEKENGKRLLTIAGVYDIWRASKNSEPIYSYSVITVPASKDMDWCHHRMPAILPTEKDVSDWLDSAHIPIQQASSLIKPQECLMSHPVSKKVNNSRCQDPDCIKPVDLSLECKPKMTASSNMMMNWLSKAQTKTSPQTSASKSKRPKLET